MSYLGLNLFDTNYASSVIYHKRAIMLLHIIPDKKHLVVFINITKGVGRLHIIDSLVIRFQSYRFTSEFT